MVYKRKPIGEEETRIKIESLGLIALQRGWPDFMVADRHWNPRAFIEVKHGNDRPSLEQSMMMEILRRFGLPIICGTQPEIAERIIILNEKGLF